MECRRTIWLGACCLAGVMGCTHPGQNAALPAPGSSAGFTPGAPRTYENGNVVHPEPELPKRAPSALTCTTYGDWFSQAAQEPGVGQARAQQDRDSALKAYQQALQLDPRFLPAYRSLARLYWDMNDPAHATQAYQKALQLYPNDARLWYEMGMGQLRQKDYAGGLAALEKAQTLEPESREFSNAFGYALARAGRYDQALAVFARHNDSAHAHFNLARMLAHMGQTDLSLQQLRLALAKDPNLTPARDLEAQLEGRTAPANEIRPAGGPQVAPPSAQPVQPVVFLDSAVSAPTPEPVPTVLPPPPMFYGQSLPVVPKQQ